MTECSTFTGVKIHSAQNIGHHEHVLQHTERRDKDNPDRYNKTRISEPASTTGNPQMV